MIAVLDEICETEQCAQLVALAVNVPSELLQVAAALLTSCGAQLTVVNAVSDLDRILDDRVADLVIVDAEQGGRPGSIALLDLVERCPHATFILIGSNESLRAVPSPLLSTRCHLLHRPVHGDQLRTTIRLALAQRCGRRVETESEQAARRRQLEDALQQIEKLARGCFATEHDAAAGAQAAWLGLRPRERQIVEALLDHDRVPAVAHRLGISTHTVRNHLKNVYRRCGVHSQQELLNLLKSRR